MSELREFGYVERSAYIVEIQFAVCRHFGVPMIEMISHRRARRVARPRQVAMYLAREMTPLSLPAIGRHFGNRDHTTVLHACQTILKLMGGDRHLAGDVADIRARLLPPADPNQMALPLAQSNESWAQVST